VAGYATELMGTPGPAADRVFAAMLEMQKLDLAALEAAYVEPIVSESTSTEIELPTPKQKFARNKKHKIK
jgi:hypothetical protein